MAFVFVKNVISKNIIIKLTTMKDKKIKNLLGGILFTVCLLFVVGFAVVKAQTAVTGSSSVDDIFKLWLEYKVAEQKQAEPPVTEKVAGIGTRTDIVIVQKTIDMDDVTTTTGAVAVNPVMGDWYVENISVATNGYTMASGTFFSIETSDAGTSGTSTLLRTAVDALTASSTLDFFSPTAPNANGTITGSVSSTQRAVLKDGKSLVAKCSVVDCKTHTHQVAAGTGGKITITAILRRIDNFGAIFD